MKINFALERNYYYKMKIIKRKAQILSSLKTHVSKYGNTPRHHTYLYLYDVGPQYELVYFDFGQKGGMVGHRYRRRWYIVGEPIAPPNMRVSMFLDVIKYIFQDPNVKKLTIEECGQDLREEILGGIQSLRFRAARSSCIEYVPLFDLEKFRDDLSGGKLKGLRYVKNRFLKYHQIDLRDAREVKSDLLIDLVSKWRLGRNSKDRVYDYDYIRFIENGFPGCDIKRAIFIDSSLRGLSAGWKIPNSRTYYVYMNIHDYSDEYLGEFVSLDHFLEAKKQGHQWLDFGGSDKSLLNFKMKFHPAAIYKTYDFSIIRD